MIETPAIVETAAQKTASIHLTIAKDQIQHEMGPGITEVNAAVAEQGITPTGPWFTHHFKISPVAWDFEICVPVDVTVKEAGRVKPGLLPARKVARTVYHGGYENLGDAWGQFAAWLRANGHTPAEDFWECYVRGPESSSNPADWRTELTRPIA